MVSSRIISIRVGAKPKNPTINQAHLPITSHSDSETEQFYDEHKTTIQKTSKKDILIVQGDWNSKIGTDCYDDWKGTVGSRWSRCNK